MSPSFDEQHESDRFPAKEFSDPMTFFSFSEDNNERTYEMVLTEDELLRRATYHPPTARAVELHSEARAHYLVSARFLMEKLPDCRETSTAQTKLEEFLFWANAAIARNHDSL